MYVSFNFHFIYSVLNIDNFYVGAFLNVSPNFIETTFHNNYNGNQPY